ncbi:MAG: tRNA pseudouridine(38-40) synthase TruA [Verrucomicrobiales bacterium]|nr:tRNA pseudouridine(38-40) synthase TruA [Verrucomicrobiales bacterium]
MLTISYDGSGFAGWQSQPRGNTIQDVLEAALARILKCPGTRIHSSGRTDAGVHALAQTAHFDAPPACRLDAAMWRNALNANLPPTLRVLRCAEMPPQFHARFDATGKTYAYRICTAPVLPPLEFGRAWHVPHPIDLGILTACCREMEGRHDFSAFAARRRGDDPSVPDYAVRSLWTVRPETTGAFLTITYHGEGFLYKMVRLLTGTQVRIAQGREPLSSLRQFLQNPGGPKSTHLAPAAGLCLVRVDYPPSILPA